MADRINAAATPAIAATLVLIRDGSEGLEVLLVVRHHEIDFARGAAVFPGGKVCASDNHPQLAQRCGSSASLDESQRVLRVAAVRETFEECGLLLARSGGMLLDAEQLAAVHGRWRERIATQDGAFVEMIRQEALELALEELSPFAHWVTPEFSPKRFDTHFFIAAAPPGQASRHDGKEAVDSFWIRPADALLDCASRRRTIIFPTLANLALLGQSQDVASALAAARGRNVMRIQPQLSKRADGKAIPVLPPDSGYPALAPALLDLVAR